VTLVRKGRAGHRWPSRPLHLFPFPPFIPRRGNSRPPPHQAVGRRRARAFLCSSPVTPPASFPSALGQGRRRPFPLPQGPAPPLLSLARCFLFRPRALRATCSAGSGYSFQRSAGKAAGVAVAGVAPRRRSLPAWCTACRAVLPGPPSRLPSSVVAGLRSAPRRPDRRLHPRPSAPEGLPPRLRARPDDRCAATGPPLRRLVLLSCPVPADLAARLPVLGRCGRLRDRENPRTLRSAAFAWCSGPSADRRSALTA
jgi:hypothetical protein